MFDSQPIADRVRDLTLPRILFNHTTLKVSIDTPRERFQMCVGILVYLLTTFRMDAVAAARQPENFSAIVAR